MLVKEKNYRQLSAYKKTIPVYNAAGEMLQEIILPERIIPIDGKRGGFSDAGVYYKGTGIVYRGHYVNQYDEEVKLLKKTNIIYERYHVCYARLLRKFGIFTFSHQEVFSDFEGACGRKEMKLIENQEQFEFSAIKDIVNVIPIGIEDHHIYAYTLREVKTSPIDVVKLIEYVLKCNFNVPWDKNLRADIYGNCYIRDVADWFISDKLSHKVGTIYALLRASYESDIYLYANVLRYFLNIYNSEKTFILYFGVLIIKKCCPGDFSELEEVEEPTAEMFEKLLQLLFNGKACCHLENEKEWLWVKEHYLSQIPKYRDIWIAHCENMV